jgi:hypothetical protein
MVVALSILRKGPGRNLAREPPAVFSLPARVESRSYRKCKSVVSDTLEEMDSDTKAVFLALCRLCQETLKSASETRLATLRIHEALVKARVPAYLEAYECTEVPFARLEKSKRELEELLDTTLRKAGTNLPKK